MQVILLAAGQSSRLDPISDKNQLEFCGKTLIEHQILALKHAKLRDIAVVGNAGNLDMLKKIAKKFSNVLVVEQKDLKDGMAGGVLAGAKAVKHKSILVMSTNDVFEEWLFEKVMEDAKEDVDGVIVGKRMDVYFPGGYLTLDKKGMVAGIVEKPAPGKEPSNLVSMVLHVYNDFPAFIKRMEKVKSKKDDRYEVALDEYIKKDKAQLKAYRYTGYWQPIKFPWHITALMAHFLEAQQPKIDKTALVSKHALIQGNVVIGAKAKIYDHAVIQGPAYIGEECVIGNNALVRGSMIGNRSVVGFCTEVARSYVNNDVWMHGNYVGDSIVDSNVSFGSGTVLGNLRFDEAHVLIDVKGARTDSGSSKFGAIIGSGVRFGINASTNPGVKIGKNSFVGPNVLVEKDIPEGKMVLLKQSLNVVTNVKAADTTKRNTPKK